MPSIKAKSTVTALAREFCFNGRKQEKAMVEVGYTPAYAKSYCGKMWENPQLKAEIARIDAKSAEKAETTVESVHSLYQTAYDAGERLNQPSAMVSAATGIARLYGMDKDNDVSADKPDSLSTAEIDVLRQDGRKLTDLKLSKGVA